MPTPHGPIAQEVFAAKASHLAEAPGSDLLLLHVNSLVNCLNPRLTHLPGAKRDRSHHWLLAE